MDYPEFRSEVVTHRGLIPLLEQLERAEDPALQYCLLKIINQVGVTRDEDSASAQPHSVAAAG